MLPLYPQLKNKLENLLRDVFEASARQELGVFAQSPRFRQHEGKTHTYNTVDGEEKTLDYHKIGVELQIEPATLIEMDFPEIVALMMDKGREFGRKQQQFHFQRINEIIEDTGNTVSGPLTLDSVIETLEKIHISFDEKGNPSMPTIVIHPNTAARMQELITEANANEEVKARMSEIIERKRMEWNEEQSSRKLVD